eukprot:11636761-Alexandrium_andersonii.AAC.1
MPGQARVRRRCAWTCPEAAHREQAPKKRPPLWRPRPSGTCGISGSGCRPWGTRAALYPRGTSSNCPVPGRRDRPLSVSR